ncbi:MAG: DNA helicase II [Xanthomonadales bacterium]|nr:DNA helicase II [Xanthomonadales bacterium]MCC6594764.1 DNA helicase II [Xanthomonadales bacterium]
MQLADLNDAQLAAVTAPPGHLLVLAGAGSGKTRVLTERIAWLVEAREVWPHAILAVTFTNKAAAEMRMRCERLLQRPTQGLWIGTFHGLAHRLLRMHWHEAGLVETFQIIDADDQQRLVKRSIAALGLDEARWPARLGTWMINAWKDEGRRPRDIDAGDNRELGRWIEVYAAYQQSCERQGLVDFAELLLRSHELWLTQPALLEHYQRRFSHLLIDEFQDTNAVQYAWIRVLAGRSAEVFAVGDDDQSIYSWRGAQVANMQAYTRDFPGVRTLRLEQNYRSSGHILAAANALIARNSERLGKQLWTAAGDGERIRVYAAYNEQDEARYVVECIRRGLEQELRADEVAILYRSNAQSRVLEEELIRHGIAYRIHGGVRFFERAEVKDALAWLRLVANPTDDGACERALATPPRGVGEKTLQELREAASTSGGLLATARARLAASAIKGRARGGLSEFVAAIDAGVASDPGLRLHERLDRLLEASGLRAHYAAQSRHDADARVENLDELLNLARSFVRSAEDEEAGISELAAFLAHAALEAGEGQAEEGRPAVQLMTLHAAKGLEFPWVFLVGMEQGLFPSLRALQEGGPAQLEEERRLAYVGITRARRLLTLSHAERRRVRGIDQPAGPSRFLSELPAHTLFEVRPRARYQAPMHTSPPPRVSAQDRQPTPVLKLGTRVAHPVFGAGIVIGAEGGGEHAHVLVNFEEHGKKLLVYAYSKLSVLGG